MLTSAESTNSRMPLLTRRNNISICLLNDYYVDQLEVVNNGFIWPDWLQREPAVVERDNKCSPPTTPHTHPHPTKPAQLHHQHWLHQFISKKQNYDSDNGSSELHFDLFVVVKKDEEGDCETHLSFLSPKASRFTMPTSGNALMMTPFFLRNTPTEEHHIVNVTMRLSWFREQKFVCYRQLCTYIYMISSRQYEIILVSISKICMLHTVVHIHI